MAMYSICHHWWSINFPFAVTHPWRIGMDASREFTRTYDITITNQTISTYIVYLGYSTSWEFDAGPISLTFFPAQFKFRGKFRFGFTAFLIQWLLHNFVYDTRAVLSWHLQNLWRSDDQLLLYSKANFPLNLNFEQKISERVWKSRRSKPCVLHRTFWLINLLNPGGFEWYFRKVIFKIKSSINGWGIPREISWANVDPYLCRQRIS